MTNRPAMAFVPIVLSFLIFGVIAAANTVENIKARGQLPCGVEEETVVNKFEDGGWVGFDIDFYRAIAAAVLGSADAYMVSEVERAAIPIQVGEIYVIISDRVPKTQEGVLFGSPVLIEEGKTRVPVVTQGDANWQGLVSAVIQATVTAEQFGLTKDNVMRAAGKPEAAPFFDHADRLGTKLGLSKDWAVRVISAVGNYGEIYARHKGASADRGQNKAKAAGGSLEGFALAAPDLAAAGGIRERTVTTENFDSLAAGDIHGQGGWQVLTASPMVSSSHQEGSLDGNAFATDDSAGGIAYRLDAFNYIETKDTHLTFSFSGRTGPENWSRAGIGFFDGETFLPVLLMGPNAKLRAWGFDTHLRKTGIQSTDRFPTKATLIDYRVTLDLVNMRGTVEVEDSEAPGIHWFTPEGMGDFALDGLDATATDGSNPRNWNSLYIRSIISGDVIDNLSLRTTRPDKLVAKEDFESMTAGDVNGQAGWRMSTGSPLVTSSYQQGSLSGNILYTDDSAGGIGFRPDKQNYIQASDTHVIVSFSGRAGPGSWSRAGVGTFDGTDYHPGLLMGSADRAWTVSTGHGREFPDSAAQSKDRYPSKETVFDFRLTMDLIKMRGTLEVEDAEAPGMDWFTPEGMADLPLASLDSSGNDGLNPYNWNALYIRSVGPGDKVDNIELRVGGSSSTGPSSGGLNKELVGLWRPNLEATEDRNGEVDASARDVFTVLAMAFTTKTLSLLVHDEPATLSINGERVTPNESFALKETEEAHVFQLILTDEEGVEHVDEVEFLGPDRIEVTLGKGGPPVVLDREPQRYTIDVVSGDGQTYAGGTMPEDMVVRIKDSSGHYITDLASAGLTLEMSSHSPGQGAPAFQSTGRSNEFRGTYGVPPSPAAAYNLRVMVQLKQDGRPIASHTFVQHIRKGP